jgi:UDP-glucose 6-dehydrogenase
LWEVLNGADCAALVTWRRKYQALDLRRMKDVMCTAELVDGRNAFEVGV